MHIPRRVTHYLMISIYFFCHQFSVIRSGMCMTQEPNNLSKNRKEMMPARVHSGFATCSSANLLSLPGRRADVTGNSPPRLTAGCNSAQTPQLSRFGFPADGEGAVRKAHIDPLGPRHS